MFFPLNAKHIGTFDSASSIKESQRSEQSDIMMRRKITEHINSYVGTAIGRWIVSSYTNVWVTSEEFVCRLPLYGSIEFIRNLFQREIKQVTWATKPDCCTVPLHAHIICGPVLSSASTESRLWVVAANMYAYYCAASRFHWQTFGWLKSMTFNTEISLINLLY